MGGQGSSALKNQIVGLLQAVGYLKGMRWSLILKHWQFCNDSRPLKEQNYLQIKNSMMIEIWLPWQEYFNNFRFFSLIDKLMATPTYFRKMGCLILPIEIFFCHSSAYCHKHVGYCHWNDSWWIGTTRLSERKGAAGLWRHLYCNYDWCI